MRHKSWAVPAGLAVLIVAILGGVGWLATRGDGAGASADRPAMLQLSSGSSVDVGTAMGAPDGSGAGSPYRLAGDLPAGRPGDQILYRLRSATAEDAASVAVALGIDGTATRVDGGWVLRDGGNRLVVGDDGGWSYGMDCAPDGPVSGEDVSVGCAVASSSSIAMAPDAAPKSPAGVSSGDTGSGGGSDPCHPDTDDCVRDIPAPKPTPAPTVLPGPSASQARAAAAPILGRLGLDDAMTTVWAGDPLATVQARPRLDGSVTVGWSTNVQIDASGDVVSGDGWVTDPDAGDRYPVVTAPRAFELLQGRPRPLMELCAVRSDGRPGCAESPPIEITGASLGLMLDGDGRHAVLVPAWLFDVRDQGQPVAQVAVDPSYLS